MSRTPLNLTVEGTLPMLESFRRGLLQQLDVVEQMIQIIDPQRKTTAQIRAEWKELARGGK